MADIYETIGEAIEDFLPQQTYTDMKVLPGHCKFTWVSIADIEGFNGKLSIEIVPGPLDLQAITRSHLDEQYAMNVMIRMAAHEGDISEVRKLRTLVDDIIGHLSFQAQGNVAWCKMTGGSINSELMEQRLIFSSTLTPVYRRQQQRR